MSLRRLACLLAAGLLSVTPAAFAAKSDSCAHCHGTDGNSSSGAYPSLAGQTKEYLIKQINAFRNGERQNSMMSPAARVLSEADVADVAEYFNSQTRVRSTFKTDPAIVAAGKALAEEKQCIACHQAGFKGLGEIPRLSRQKQPYIVRQLKAFRDGTRKNEVMAPLAQQLTDEQIEALAQYITGL